MKHNHLAYCRSPPGPRLLQGQRRLGADLSWFSSHHTDDSISDDVLLGWHFWRLTKKSGLNSQPIVPLSFLRYAAAGSVLEFAFECRCEDDPSSRICKALRVQTGNPISTSHRECDSWWFYLFIFFLLFLKKARPLSEAGAAASSGRMPPLVLPYYRVATSFG